MNNKQITKKDLANAANMLSVDIATVQAVIEIEGISDKAELDKFIYFIMSNKFDKYLQNKEWHLFAKYVFAGGIYVGNKLEEIYDSYN